MPPLTSFFPKPQNEEGHTTLLDLIENDADIPEQPQPKILGTVNEENFAMDIQSADGENSDGV